MHPLAEKATERFEAARKTVARFLHAKHTDEIVFTKNATEAINLVAHAWGRCMLHEGDVVLLSELEHHSNVIPWLQLAEEKNVRIAWIRMDHDGTISQAHLQQLLHEHPVKLCALTGLSNVIGVRQPLEHLIMQAHDRGAAVLIDASQLAAHDEMNVAHLDCEFLAFSGHKLYGPDGIGVLYAKRQLLEAMPPFLGGGGMIRDVTINGFAPADPPQRFEAGTQPISGAIGLAAALEWAAHYSWHDRLAHEQQLMRVLHETLASLPGITILGNIDPEDRRGCISFTMKGAHPHDIAELLGSQNICVRAGQHCAQILHQTLGIPASVRVSLGMYTTEEEIRKLGEVLNGVQKKLKI